MCESTQRVQHQSQTQPRMGVARGWQWGQWAASVSVYEDRLFWEKMVVTSSCHRSMHIKMKNDRKMSCNVYFTIIRNLKILNANLKI